MIGLIIIVKSIKWKTGPKCKQKSKKYPNNLKFLKGKKKNHYSFKHKISKKNSQNRKMKVFILKYN